MYWWIRANVIGWTSAEAQLPTYFSAGQTRHHQVEQDDVGAMLIELGDAARTIVRLDHLEALFGEHVGQGLEVGLLILNDKHSCHCLIS